MPNGLHHRPATLTDRGFPQEICKRIVRYVTSSHDLAVLARVCVEFQTEAERKLYQYQCLQTQSMIARLSKLFVSCPRVAAHVRTLVLDCTPRHVRTVMTSSLLQSFNMADLLADALAQMPRLEVFHYNFPGSPLPRMPVPPVFQLLDAQLECDWDDNLILFIDGQTRIIRLSLGDTMQCPVGIGQDGALLTKAEEMQPPEGLHPGWMPHLKMLRGPWQIVMFLVQGRPVCDIKTKYPPWNLTDPDDDERFTEHLPRFLQALTKSSAEIIRLDMGECMTDSVSMSFVYEASRFLPSLEKTGRLPIPEAQYMAFMEHMGRMKKIRMVDFIIRGDYGSSVMPRILTHQMAIYATLLESMCYVTPTEVQIWRKRRLAGGDLGDYDEWVLTDSTSRRMPLAGSWYIR